MRSGSGWTGQIPFTVKHVLSEAEGRHLALFIVRSWMAVGRSSVMVAGPREVDCNFASIAAGQLYCRKVFVDKELDFLAAGILVAGT